jgi:hypothetical protein
MEDTDQPAITLEEAEALYLRIPANSATQSG